MADYSASAIPNSLQKSPDPSISSRRRRLFLLGLGCFSTRRFGGSLLPFEIGQAALSLASDSMLLTHGSASYKAEGHPAQREKPLIVNSRLPMTCAISKSNGTLCPFRSVIMPKILIGASVLLLTLSAVFGVLNSTKVKGLRLEMENATKAREFAERARAAQQKNLKGHEARGETAQPKSADTEARIASAESDLIKSQSEKTALQSKLQASASEIAELKKQVEQIGPNSPQVAGPSTAELQAQLEETRKQLESAESENALLSEKVRSRQEKPPSTEVRKQRSAPTGHPGLRGTVLAVNQAYNFVVLNLGGRQGVEANSEMLVLRNGTLIGKIRVSSVEPATAIGDIISSTLTRGVQVQPGDNVIYAGTSM